MDPITTPEAEQKFLEAAEAVFFKGKRRPSLQTTGTSELKSPKMQDGNWVQIQRSRLRPSYRIT